MAVSPDQAAGLARATAALYLDAERVLIERIARLVARDLRDEEIGDQLAAVRELRRHVEQVAEQLAQESARTVAAAVEQAANIGDRAAVDELGDAAGDPAGRVPGSAGVAALAAETVTSVQEAHTRLLPWALGVYRDVIAAASGGVLLGADSRREAAQRAIDQLVARGVTGFVDRAGRGWDLASYVEMAVRTATGRAAVDAHVDRLTGSGLDLVIVSDSPRECPLCRPYEGKVLSTSGGAGRVTAVNPATGEPVTVDVDGSLDEARRAGLFHPNCRHSVSAYMPGLTTPRGSSEPDGYEQQQRQRAIERRIREWKRREAGALTEHARARAGAKVRQWQGALRDHLASHEALKRQRHREQIGRAR
ncbi:minor capsid protein 2 [Haloactinopolyspora alba]|uniref:Minor capsid protein 2 n=1 Tax=Haloactinopolyspora alba TaxID=648780 RepID=A0A2P8DEZ1_9ACTN|nr:phage minor capsid protein [Haloactinopolyspora alba]PSK95780.1 minor capsid protein 2 [Haloactinopolyspora alba]